MCETPTRLHHLLDRWIRQEPDRLLCIDHDGQTHSFADVGQAVDEATSSLTDNGVRPGDRVMIVAENSLALFAFILACSRLDAWALLVNARITLREIERLAGHAEPRAIVFTHGASTEAGGHGKALDAVALGQQAFGRVMIAGHRSATPEPTSQSPDEQVAALLYTTGTTGDPKGVMLTHANLLFMASASCAMRGLSAQDHFYCVLPMTHVFAFASISAAALYAGSVMEFVPRFNVQAVFDAFAGRVTAMPAVPAMFAHLLDHAKAQGITKAPAPNLRYLSTGGAPLDPDLKKRVEDCFGVVLQNGYGLTEASPGVAATHYGETYEGLSCGRAIGAQDVRIVPAPGRDALVDGVGEIVTKGPNVMKGYYKNSEATAKAIDPDGFLHTGDLGYLTEEGTLFVVGRCKELIIRSGFNVYPPDVEAVLNAHPSVVQSAVVGRKLVDGNEEVLAFAQVLDRDQIDEDTLKEFASIELAPYKRPSRIIIATALPSSPIGKLLKHKMIETFADRLDPGSLP